MGWDIRKNPWVGKIESRELQWMEDPEEEAGPVPGGWMTREGWVNDPGGERKTEEVLLRRPGSPRAVAAWMYVVEICNIDIKFGRVELQLSELKLSKEVSVRKNTVLKLNKVK